MPHQLDHNTYTYIAVTLSPSSPFLASPPSLAARHADLALNYIGQVGELSDVLLYAIPKTELAKRGGDAEDLVVKDLQGSDGVLDVEVQKLRQRTKRGGDEL